MELELIEELKAAKQTCIEKHIASLSEIDQLLEALGASEKNNIKLPNLNFAIAEADEPYVRQRDLAGHYQTKTN